VSGAAARQYIAALNARYLDHSAPVLSVFQQKTWPAKLEDSWTGLAVTSQTCQDTARSDATSRVDFRKSEAGFLSILCASHEEGFCSRLCVPKAKAQVQSDLAFLRSK